jgi:hypothetical protein
MDKTYCFNCTRYSHALVPVQTFLLPRRQAAGRVAPEPEEAGQPDTAAAGGMDAAPQAHHDAAPGQGRLSGKAVTIFRVNFCKELIIFCEYI